MRPDDGNLFITQSSKWATSFLNGNLDLNQGGHFIGTTPISIWYQEDEMNTPEEDEFYDNLSTLKLTPLTDELVTQETFRVDSGIASISQSEAEMGSQKTSERVQSRFVLGYLHDPFTENLVPRAGMHIWNQAERSYTNIESLISNTAGGSAIGDQYFLEYYDYSNTTSKSGQPKDLRIGITERPNVVLSNTAHGWTDTPRPLRRVKKNGKRVRTRGGRAFRSRVAAWNAHGLAPPVWSLRGNEQRRGAHKE